MLLARNITDNLLKEFLFKFAKLWVKKKKNLKISNLKVKFHQNAQLESERRKLKKRKIEVQLNIFYVYFKKIWKNMHK